MTTRTMTTQLAATTATGPLALLRSAFRQVAEVIASASAGVAAAREVERLMSLSDAELARRGLARDEIVHRVFERYLR